jgi:hypothetical protein
LWEINNVALEICELLCVKRCNKNHNVKIYLLLSIVVCGVYEKACWILEAYNV